MPRIKTYACRRLQPVAIAVMKPVMFHGAPFVTLTVDAAASGLARRSDTPLSGLLLRLSSP